MFEWRDAEGTHRRTIPRDQVLSFSRSGKPCPPFSSGGLSDGTPDEISLNDGRHYSGKIVEINRSSVVFTWREGGEARTAAFLRSTVSVLLRAGRPEPLDR
jgi:hypothetical protein